MANYIELRREALVINRTEGPKHLCQRGKGECCEPDIVIGEGDASLIQRGFMDGKIPKAILEKAVENALDLSRDRCPFLGEDNECTIYDRRPIICILTGAGAAPFPIGKRITEAVPVTEVQDPSCESCFNRMQENGFKYSRVAVAGFDRIMQQVTESGVLNMKSLLLARLHNFR